LTGPFHDIDTCRTFHYPHTGAWVEDCGKREIMERDIFEKEDLRELKKRGMPKDEISAQIEIFEKGIPKSRLNRPCKIGDGIVSLTEDDLTRLEGRYDREASKGRAMKFVPASGAASRMFKSLLSFYNLCGKENDGIPSTEDLKKEPENRPFFEFIEGIESFAFYDNLKSALAMEGLDVETLISTGQYREILEYVLTSKGLDLADLPKGLIPFHHYPLHPRTPFEEHLVEAAAIVKDQEGITRLHFTVSESHESVIRRHIEENLDRYGTNGIAFDITFSIQKHSTDTIAVDLKNRPFRGDDGKLLFRPGGHGALLENLNDLAGDIIFIKNIDNVVPDRLKPETHAYKKALGGYLVDLQEEIFKYLRSLIAEIPDTKLVKEICEFLRFRLSVPIPDHLHKRKAKERQEFLMKRLNRPLRICGMVKNEGEPGGGPFWVEHDDRTLSIQIVESSQVEMNSEEQKAIWESSTHFNPVDLVCGVRDYRGGGFDLLKYRDPDTGFISIKSKGGRELKALELPGLWNGAMAFWNTAFVEVPMITFNPVKTVLDLLREEHQPSSS
jgi:hypothetical protein